MKPERIKRLIAAYRRAEALSDREWRNPARPSGGYTQKGRKALTLACDIALKLPDKIGRQIAPDRVF